MGIITTYPADTTPADDDKYLTSDASGATKLTSASDLKSYVLSDGSVTSSTLAESVGNFEAATTWAPTVANLTLGNGTLTGSYIQIGRLVSGHLSLIRGSTTSFSGQLTFTPPVDLAVDTYNAQTIVGSVHVLDTGTNNFFGPLLVSSDTSLDPRLYFVTGSYQTTNIINATTPMTWATGDALDITFSYIASTNV